MISINISLTNNENELFFMFKSCTSNFDDEPLGPCMLVHF